MIILKSATYRPSFIYIIFSPNNGYNFTCKYFSINFGCIKGYVQFSGNLSISTTLSISLCNSFANSVISAKQSSPNVSSPLSFTLVLPVTEYTHISFISNLIAPVPSCNSLLAVSRIFSPASLCPPGTSYLLHFHTIQNNYIQAKE